MALIKLYFTAKLFWREIENILAPFLAGKR